MQVKLFTAIVKELGEGTQTVSDCQKVGGSLRFLFRNKFV